MPFHNGVSLGLTNNRLFLIDKTGEAFVIEGTTYVNLINIMKLLNIDVSCNTITDTIILDITSTY